MADTSRMSFSINRVPRLFHLYVRAEMGSISTAATTSNPRRGGPLVKTTAPGEQVYCDGFLHAHFLRPFFLRFVLVPGFFVGWVSIGPSAEPATASGSSASSDAPALSWRISRNWL